jgi:hypothetical protein
MPDRYDHIDKAFSDQAWSEMQRLLDREMPVRPAPFFWLRKRLLWLLLLLIPIGAAWGYYQFRQTHAAEEAPAIRPETPAPAPVSKPIAEALPAAAAEGEEVLPPDPVVLQAYTSAAAPLNREVSEMWEPAETLPSGLSEAGIKPLDRLTSPAQFARAKQPALQGSQPAPVEVLKKRDENHAWSLSLEAGGMAHAGFESPGLTAGLRLGRQLGQSAWGLQTGLGYAWYVNPFTESLLTANLRGMDAAALEAGFFNEVDPNNMGQEPTVSVDRLAASTDSVVSRLHFLEIPLSLTRQVGKRWQLHAGGGLALLAAARTETGASNGFGLFSGMGRTDQTSEFEDLTPQGSSAGFRLDEFATAYPFLEAGVAFRPLPRLSLSGQWHSGLSDMLPQWPGTQSMSSFRIKVSYCLR